MRISFYDVTSRTGTWSQGCSLGPAVGLFQVFQKPTEYPEDEGNYTPHNHMIHLILYTSADQGRVRMRRILLSPRGLTEMLALL